MRSHPTFKVINKKFLQAVDHIKAAYEAHPTKKKLFDNGIGTIISPSNKSVVGGIRKGQENLNHYQLLTFADHFNIPYEYFYYEHLELTFAFDQNNPDNFFSNLTDNRQISPDEVTEGELKKNGIAHHDLGNDKIEVYQNLLKSAKEVNNSKDILIAAKDEQIVVLTRYNEKLEKLLENS